MYGEYIGFGLMFIYLIIVTTIIALLSMYYKTIIDTMSLIQPQNREVNTGNIMFMFIPVFNAIYGFILFPKICNSIKREFTSHNQNKTGDYGVGLAIGHQICIIANIVPLLNIISFPATIILWILFWIKINGYKEELMYLNNKFNAVNGQVSQSKDILD